jgi:hypothetical protein
LQIKFFVFFAILGFLISFLCGVSVGNKFFYVLMLSAISAICLGGLGFIVYLFLEKNIPEFLEVVGESNLSGSSFQDDSDNEPENNRRGSTFNTTVSDSGTGSRGASYSDEIPKVDTYSKPAGKKSNGNFGDHLVVDNIPLKNEPKLMADAIRTIMAQDDGS